MIPKIFTELVAGVPKLKKEISFSPYFIILLNEANTVMDKLDETIDTHERDKVITLIQENSVRVGKLNIKFTKLSKKDSLERWQAFYDSYHRLLINIPKGVLRIEREVRQKFVSPLTQERIEQLRWNINEEIDLVVKKLEGKCRLDFKKLGREEELDSRLKATLKKCSELLESEISKCSDKLEISANESGKIQLKDLALAFGTDEGLLHQLNILDPLQAINTNLNSNAEGPLAKSLFDDTVESIKYLLRGIQNLSIDSTGSVAVKKAAKMEVAKESMQVMEIIRNIDYMVEQIKLTGDNKNSEVLEKIWLQLEHNLDNGKPDWVNLIPKFKSLYEFIENKGK